jgi:hypothetical protein
MNSDQSDDEFDIMLEKALHERPEYASVANLAIHAVQQARAQQRSAQVAAMAQAAKRQQILTFAVPVVLVLLAWFCFEHFHPSGDYETFVGSYSNSEATDLAPADSVDSAEETGDFLGLPDSENLAYLTAGPVLIIILGCIVHRTLSADGDASSWRMAAG